MEITKEQLGSRAKRFAAYLIDVIPISILVFLAFYLLTDFDEVVRRYFADGSGIDERAEYMTYRSWVRYVSFIIWLIYCGIMEASNKQATLGKMAMGIKVVDKNGSRMSPGVSLVRNTSKILSMVVLLLGFIWILFDNKRQGWHDKIAKTYVVETDPPFKEDLQE